jgi:hypothetical protein
MQFQRSTRQHARELRRKISSPDVFKDGLGQCTLTKATLTLKQNATPAYCGERVEGILGKYEIVFI